MKLKDYEIKEQLRKLSKNIKKSDKVLLPKIEPRKMWDSTIDDIPFVDVPLAKLLHFIADML